MISAQPIVFRSDVVVELAQPVMGSDASVIAAARVSTMGERAQDEMTADPERSAGLINFLMRDRHGSPFEHATMTVRVKAPIFVFREWHRHRVQSFNEMSGRYTVLEPEFYVPGPQRPLKQVGKPGQYRFEPAPDLLPEQDVRMVQSYQMAWNAYQAGLEAGVAKEVARAVLPVGTYSTMYATANLRAWLHFLSLRTSAEGAHFPSFPQYEIEMAAQEVERLVAAHFPLSYAAFVRNGRVAP